MIFYNVDKVNATEIENLLEEENFADRWQKGEIAKSIDCGTFLGIIAKEEHISGLIYSTVCLDEADICIVYVKKSERKKGLGGKLIDMLLTELKEKGVKKVFLEVRKNNLPAISLYSSSGFNISGVRIKYYGDEDALMMSKTI